MKSSAMTTPLPVPSALPIAPYIALVVSLLSITDWVRIYAAVIETMAFNICSII